MKADKYPFASELITDTEGNIQNKRGLFRTAKNFLINADVNGAANVIKKVAITLGLDLKGISRVCLTTPQRLFIWKNPTRF